MNAMAYLRTFQTTTMKLFFPAGIYLFKVKNRNTRTMCETSSKLAIKTPQSGDIFNFDFLEKCLRIVSPPHFVYDFSTNMFLMLYSVN